MPAFGENLRREREMRGVSLDEISAATKISLRFLDAIEREDFAKLPGGIFSRSFIRSYARYLGLDEERVVAEYQLAAHPQTDFDLRRMPSGTASSGSPSSRTPYIATLIAVILLVGGYVLFRYAPRVSEAPASLPPAPVETAKPATPPPVPTPAPSGETTTPPVASPPAGTEAPTMPPSTPAATNPTLTPKTASPAGTSATVPPNPGATNPVGAMPPADGDLVLQVAATERAWMAIDADGKTVLQRVLNPDEVETLKAHKSFDVTTGNAQAVILTLNGETLKPLGRRGEVKTVHLTHDDLKNSQP
ncbi:MAG TPA: RodZ domain-containing protein [Terriglobia bacterium]|nr:RodZ domain-containing protein [Terriglobia bacterium]